MEAEREATLMRELAAEAALRRIRDPIVVHDETPTTSNAEEEALDSASMEDSRRAEDELELYLLNVSDEEPMEVGHYAVPRSPTPPEACIARGSPLRPVEEAAGPAPLLVRPEARDEPPRPQRVWPYADENWARTRRKRGSKSSESCRESSNGKRHRRA